MEFRVWQSFLFLASVLYLSAVAEQHEPQVHTELGSLRGEYVSVKGKETGVHAFLGIPFAKPPVGPALRLAAPQPVERWEGVRDATQQPPMCIQNKQHLSDLFEILGVLLAHIPDISEDCLYLNIYTPANRGHGAKLPVMVRIHGGGLSMGSASLYDGSALAAYQNVVVVLIQYRLGLLGFLSTNDEHMSGNYGMLDQVQALKWTQEHIHNFGGDPDLVTIFGESAGGTSVSLLLLSPLSDGLFHHAIAESGTAAIPVDFLVDSNDPLSSIKTVANISGCSLKSSEEMADCMRNVDIDTILTIGQDGTLRFFMNVDGHFLKKPVDELFQKHELLTLPFITGVNNDEGGWLIPNLLGISNWTEGMDREQVINFMSMFIPDSKDAVIIDLMVDEYIGTGEDRVMNRNGFTEMLGDLVFNIPAIRAANAHRDAGAPVYLYEYQHPPKYQQAKRPNFVRCDHGDELFVVLGYCFTTNLLKYHNVTCSEEEELLSKTMMTYWGNFVRTGSPNGVGVVHWPKYGTEEYYFKIGLKEQTTGQHLKKERFVFLTETILKKTQQQKEKEHSDL